MTIEYRLEKKMLGGWQQISWWTEEDKAKAENSFKACAKPNSGYAWRLVKVEVIEECKLEEQTPVYKDEVAKIWNTPESQAKANVWAGNEKTEWGKPAINNNWNAPAKPEYKEEDWDFEAAKNKPFEHGLTGSIWMIHHANKIKKRIDPTQEDMYIKLGYERGGPKTAFRS